MFRPPQVYSGFRVLEQISLTVSMKVFMNNISIFQVNEINQPNGVQGRAPTEGHRGRPDPLRIFIFKGASVASVWGLKIRTHQCLFKGSAVVWQRENRPPPSKTMQSKFLLSLGQIIHQSYVEFSKITNLPSKKILRPIVFLIISQKPELG